MTIRHHPRDETLMEYAAGAMVPALSLLIDCHLSRCAQCRVELVRMQAIGGALLNGIKGAEVSDKALDKVLAAIREGRGAAGGERPANHNGADRVLPAPLARRLGTGIDAIGWRKLAPGVEQLKIEMPRRGGDLRLLRVQPGLKLLRHGHHGTELTMVLKGAYADETGEYHEGEVADLDEEIEHRPHVIGEGECICIVAGETYPRYTSFTVRLLRPFLGL